MEVLKTQFGRRAVSCLILWCGLLTSTGSLKASQPETVDEYRVKAVFLYNFAKFVEWPSYLGSDTICIGVLGDDPFGDLLNQIVDGKTVNGRGFVIRHLKLEQARQCQIVFVSASEKRNLRSILASLKGAGVLTVGETSGFAEMGGVINFQIVESKVRFEVNISAADLAHIKLSSKLLSLAKIVRGRGN